MDGWRNSIVHMLSKGEPLKEEQQVNKHKQAVSSAAVCEHET